MKSSALGNALSDEEHVLGCMCDSFRAWTGAKEKNQFFQYQWLVPINRINPCWDSSLPKEKKKKKKERKKKILLFMFQVSIPKLSFSFSTVQIFCPFSPFTNMAETFNFMRQIPIIGLALGIFLLVKLQTRIALFFLFMLLQF